MEIWKDIEGYSGAYRVSNKGSLSSFKNGKFIIMKPNNERGSYSRVCLYNLGESRTFSIHRLVASAFVLNPENKTQVNHLNGLKQDNRAENLEWCTRSENQRHAIATGLFKPKGSKAGNNPNSIKIKQLTKDGQIINVFEGVRDASRATKICNSSISEAINKKRKSAGGFIWQIL